MQSFPPAINISTGTICNLACTFCHTGQGIDQQRENKTINIDTVHKLFKEVGKKAILARLYTYGEPMLVKNLDEIVKICNQYKVYSIISCNMNAFNEDLMRRVLKNGIDHIIVAIDGVSQDTYNKYRINGDYNVALSNVKKLLELKKQTDRHDLIIEWQFVPFAHNEHEVDSAKKIAEELGVNIFTIFSPYVTDEKYLPKNKKYNSGLGSSEKKGVSCRRPWTNIVLQVDGGISACANNSIKKEDDVCVFENIQDSWQKNKKMQYIRERILGKTDKTEDTICEKTCFKKVN